MVFLSLNPININESLTYSKKWRKVRPQLLCEKKFDFAIGYYVSVRNLEATATWKGEQSTFSKHNYFVFSPSLWSAIRFHFVLMVGSRLRARLLCPYILLVIITFLHLTVWRYSLLVLKKSLTACLELLHCHLSAT